MWEQVTNWINEFTNNPTVIAISSVLTLIVGALVIFSKTSLGKTAIRKLTDLARFTDAKVENAKEQIRLEKQEIAVYKEQLTHEVQEFKEDTKNKIVAIYSEYTYLKVYFFKVFELIPNAKVQSELAIAHQLLDKKEHDIKELLGDTYETIEQVIENEVQNRTKEAYTQIAALTGEIEKLKELVDGLTKEPENATICETTEELNDGEE